MRKIFNLMFAAVMLMTAQSVAAQDVTTVFDESFAAFTEGSEAEPSTTDISSGVTNKLSTTLTGWSGRYVYEAGGMLKIGDGGNLQTARYDMKANKGIIKISMRVRSYDESGAMFTIAVNYSNKVTDYVFDNNWHEVSYVVNGASTVSTTYLKITASMAASGILVDDLKVEQSEAFYPAPVAKQPTQADGTSFTAKWDYISGSTGYYLDVYTKDDNGDPVYALQNQLVSGGYTSSYKVTGLDASKRYYFVVRATNGTATSENSNEIEVVKVISKLDVPEALPASEVTANGFTANWNGVADAEGYEVSVYKVETMKEDKTVTVAAEDFSALKEGTVSAPVYPSLSEYLDKYTNESGWYAYAHLYAEGLLGLAPFSSTSPATLLSPSKDLSSNGGKFTVKVRMGATKSGVYVAGDEITVNVYNDETLLESQKVTLLEGLNDYTLTFTKGNADTFVEFSFPSTTDRAWIDNIEIIQDKKKGDEVISLIYVADAENHFSHAFDFPFTDGVSYRYSVCAYVLTVVNGEVSVLQSDDSELVSVAYKEPTSVADIDVAKAVKSVRYFDLAGREVSQPAEGVTIAVTTYTDGTVSSKKVMK